MFKKILTSFFIFFCLAGIFYLALPNYGFPFPPPDAIQSQEPADLETPVRRAYFTNFSREEVLVWYGKQLNSFSIFDIKILIPAILLNYPPEYAQTIIRDQTSSSFLQEYAHPLRESIYINGFAPRIENNIPAFTIDNETRELKIIVKYVSSSIILRELIFVASIIMILIIYNIFEKLICKK